MLEHMQTSGDNKTRKIKVLWFANTPANADDYFNSQLTDTGGWLKALDQAIQDKVELHIAFYHKQQIDSFQHLKTHYHPMLQYRNVFGKLKARVFNEIIEDEHLPVYLDLINKINPDIIDIHGTENPFGVILNKTPIPVAVTIQGNITVYDYKFCSGIERQYLNLKKIRPFGLKSLVFPHSFKNTRKNFKKMQKREGKNIRHCRYIIGRTDWDKRITRVLAPERIYFHNDRIFRRSFYQAQWQPHDHKKIILHTTNSNNFFKGFETLCLALHELNRLGIDCEWRVAGIKDDDLIVKVVKRKIKNRFPRKNLKLLGGLSEKELVEKLLEADIYVMTSHIENSPNNLCEAMILGIPCLATFAGGTGSLLRDGYEGILIQDGDPWAMAGAVLELKDDYEKAVTFGENARKRALARHDKNRIADELVGIYAEIQAIHHNDTGNES